MDQPSSVESSITFKEAEMQLHQVDLGAHKLQIYLPKSRTKMLAEAQTEEVWWRFVSSLASKMKFFFTMHSRTIYHTGLSFGRPLSVLAGSLHANHFWRIGRSSSLEQDRLWLDLLRLLPRQRLPSQTTSQTRSLYVLTMRQRTIWLRPICKPIGRISLNGRKDSTW